MERFGINTCWTQPRCIVCQYIRGRSDKYLAYKKKLKILESGDLFLNIVSFCDATPDTIQIITNNDFVYIFFVQILLIENLTNLQRLLYLDKIKSNQIKNEHHLINHITKTVPATSSKQIQESLCIHKTLLCSMVYEMVGSLNHNCCKMVQKMTVNCDRYRSLVRDFCDHSWMKLIQKTCFSNTTILFFNLM